MSGMRDEQIKYILDKELEIFKTSEDDKELIMAADSAYDLLKDKKIVLYGAGASGRSLQSCLKKLGISILFFVDKKYEDIVEADGTEVRPIETLDQCTDTGFVVIITIDTSLFLEFRQEIRDNILKYCPEALVVQQGRELTLLLKRQICQERLSAGEQFSIVDCINCGAETRKCDVFNQYLRTVAVKSDIDKSKLPLKYNRYFGCIMGNVCTLRCKSCCEMVPYHRERDYADADTLIENCRSIADATQFTMFIEVVGGEPFMHPKIDYILKGLLEIPDVGFVRVFTNGTVVPGEKLLEVLQNPRMVVVWSNYRNTVSGKLWENTERTRELFEQRGIPYIYSAAKTWLDFSSFEYADKTEEELERDFEDCFLANCFRVHDGVLYRCPHHYAAARLNKGEYAKEGSVNLRECDSSYGLSVKLLEFKEQKYVDACRYCVVPHKAKEVPAGGQLEQ